MTEHGLRSVINVPLMKGPLCYATVNVFTAPSFSFSGMAAIAAPPAAAPDANLRNVRRSVSLISRPIV